LKTSVIAGFFLKQNKTNLDLQGGSLRTQMKKSANFDAIHLDPCDAQLSI
jgi:hypothetical protein